MTIFKIADCAELESAVRNLKAANAALAANKKTADNAKATIARILKEQRQLEIETLPIGELVCVNSFLIIEIGKQNKFDAAQFQLDEPALYEGYKKDFPCVKYKALI